jgi:hypothetical protein
MNIKDPRIFDKASDDLSIPCADDWSRAGPSHLMEVIYTFLLVHMRRGEELSSNHIIMYNAYLHRYIKAEDPSFGVTFDKSFPTFILTFLFTFLSIFHSFEICPFFLDPSTPIQSFAIAHPVFTCL